MCCFCTSTSRFHSFIESRETDHPAALSLFVLSLVVFSMLCSFLFSRRVLVQVSLSRARYQGKNNSQRTVLYVAYLIDSHCYVWISLQDSSQDYGSKYRYCKGHSRFKTGRESDLRRVDHEDWRLKMHSLHSCLPTSRQTCRMSHAHPRERGTTGYVGPRTPLLDDRRRRWHTRNSILVY